jgi:vanillate O-demethylase monooxygenase subunit
MNESGGAERANTLRHYWHPVAWSNDVGAGPYATELLGERLVIWRDGDSSVAAADQCPHRGTRLSLGTVEGAHLVCPYHGWTFGPTGMCTTIPQLSADSPIPPRAALTTYRTEEQYGIIWVALDEPAAPIPAFPEWDDPSYRHVPCPTYTWAAGAGRMVENFTDFGHLGYLHDGLLGSRDDLVVPPHRVRTEGNALFYEIAMSVPNTDGEFAVTDVSGEFGLQTNTYVLTLPFTIHLRCLYHDTGTYRTLFFASQPRSSGESTGYCYQSRNFDLDQPDAPFAEFQEVLAAQDQPIVESQWPTEVPLGPTDELHLPFDRVAIAYRRALATLIAGGTAPAPNDRAHVDA